MSLIKGMNYENVYTNLLLSKIKGNKKIMLPLLLKTLKTEKNKIPKTAIY